jgi:hypothetical protein
MDMTHESAIWSILILEVKNIHKKLCDYKINKLINDPVALKYEKLHL